MLVSHEYNSITRLMLFANPHRKTFDMSSFVHDKKTVLLIACYASRSIASSCRSSWLFLSRVITSLVVAPPWISNFSSGQHLPLLVSFARNRSSNLLALTFRRQSGKQTVSLLRNCACENYKNCGNFTVSNSVVGSFRANIEAHSSQNDHFSNQV